MDGGGGGGAQPQAVVCGKEALDLLNCVAESAYDHDKCLLLLTNLRNCVLSKVSLFLMNLQLSIKSFLTGLVFVCVFDNFTTSVRYQD